MSLEGWESVINTFDKICAAPAALLGALFLLLGMFGLFNGAAAHFTLPPILGVFPAFVGWGMLRAIYIAWRTPPATTPKPVSQVSDPPEWLNSTGSGET